MNRREVATVLGAASAVDPKVPQPDADVLSMWAALLDDVPADIAVAAVREHYRRRAHTIMPADIVEHWRTVRRETAERQHNAELRARQLDPPRLATLRAGIVRVTTALAIAHAATQARQIDNRARRTEIVGRLEAPSYTFTATTIHGMGSKTLDHVPAPDEKALANALSTHLSAAGRLEQVDADKASEGAKSMLGGLAVALGIRAVSDE